MKRFRIRYTVFGSEGQFEEEVEAYTALGAVAELRNRLERRGIYIKDIVGVRECHRDTSE